MKKNIVTIRNTSYFVSLLLAVALIAFILLQNIAPLGINVTYSLQQDTKYLSPPSPQNRIKQENDNGVTLYKQISDIVYFSTGMPFHFDTATVKVQLKNDTPEQSVKLAIKIEMTGIMQQKMWMYHFCICLHGIRSAKTLYYINEIKHITQFLTFMPDLLLILLSAPMDMNQKGYLQHIFLHTNLPRKTQSCVSR